MKLEILDKAIALSKEMGWTTEYLARDANGVPIDVIEPEACSFCTMGFLQRAQYELTGDLHYATYDLHQAIYKVLGPDIAISSYNDEVAISVDDIAELFEKAKQYV